MILAASMGLLPTRAMILCVGAEDGLDSVNPVEQAVQLVDWSRLVTALDRFFGLGSVAFHDNLFSQWQSKPVGEWAESLYINMILSFFTVKTISIPIE
jgi:hypothetical protein